MDNFKRFYCDRKSREFRCDAVANACGSERRHRAVGEGREEAKMFNAKDERGWLTRVLRLLLASGVIVVMIEMLGLPEPVVKSALGADQPSLCDAITGNLVVNCGFETADFTGWTITPANPGSLFGVNGNPHTGDNAAFFGAITPPFADSISQSIPTIPEQTYNVAFWLMNLARRPGESIRGDVRGHHPINFHRSV
jgi:hypothetical protein